MKAISIDLKMKRITNNKFVKTACDCAPKLLKKEVKPVSIIKIEADKNGDAVIAETKPIEMLAKIKMKKGDKICLDVRYVSS